jgi:hypothetical protein
VVVIRKRTIPTERPPLVGEVSANLCARSAQRIPTAVTLGFLDGRRHFFIQVAPQLSSRDWVDPVPDPYFSENVVWPGIEAGTSGSVARNSDH